MGRGVSVEMTQTKTLVSDEELVDIVHNTLAKEKLYSVLVEHIRNNTPVILSILRDNKLVYYFIRFIDEIDTIFPTLYDPLEKYVVHTKLNIITDARPSIEEIGEILTSPRKTYIGLNSSNICELKLMDIKVLKDSSIYPVFIIEIKEDGMLI
jgi:hypothetical protein